MSPLGTEQQRSVAYRGTREDSGIRIQDSGSELPGSRRAIHRRQQPQSDRKGVRVMVSQAGNTRGLEIQ